MMKKPSYLDHHPPDDMLVDDSSSSLLHPRLASQSLLANVLDVSDDTVGRIKWLNEARSMPTDHRSINADKTTFVDANASAFVSKMNFALDSLSHLELILNDIRVELHVVTDKMRDEANEAEVKRHWKFAAIVLDRLCLVLFTAVFSIATCAIIFGAPQLVV